MVPPLVVHDEVHATRIVFERSILPIDARIEQAGRSTADTKLVVRKGEERLSLLLPPISLVPLAPRLAITVPIVLTISLQRRRPGGWTK